MPQPTKKEICFVNPDFSPLKPDLTVTAIDGVLQPHLPTIVSNLPSVNSDYYIVDGYLVTKSYFPKTMTLKDGYSTYTITSCDFVGGRPQRPPK